MNIIDRLFKRGDKVKQATAEQPTKATAEQTEAELELQLAEIEIGIAAGEGDVVALLEEKESLKLQIIAVNIVRQKASDEAYRASHKKISDEYRARMMPIAEAVADLAPRLQWYCHLFQKLEDEAHRKNVPNSGLDETNIPFGFGRKVFEAIRDAAPDVEWHVDFLNDPAARNPLPRKKAARHHSLYARQTDVHGNTVGQRIDPGTGLLVLPLPNG